MHNFLVRIEADIKKFKPTDKPIYNGKRKNVKKNKPNQADEPAKPTKPKAAKGKVSFSNLTETKKLIPFIEKALGGTDPFAFDNTSWDRFFEKVIPRLLYSVFLDMGIVPREKREEFTRHLMRRIKPVSK